MKRVLVTGAANIGKAGVATIVYKWGQNFSDELVYDYLMQRGEPDQPYLDHIREKGSVIYTMDAMPKNLFKVIDWAAGIVRQHHYQVIHINTDSAYIAAAYIAAARRGGAERIIVHSHCTRIDDNSRLGRLIKTTLHYLCRPYVKAHSERYLACSEPAGRWMFGAGGVASARYTLIENGVETALYRYRQDTRERLRHELKLENRLAIGNIGRFSYQKNHARLIELFQRYHQRHPEAALVLIGEGDLEPTIRGQVEAAGLQDSVLFLGRRGDVQDLLSALDVLAMPSLFEGLPVTAVEAQMASLPCVLADTITREAGFTSHVCFVPLEDTEGWISAIERMAACPRPYSQAELEASPFNVSQAAKKLEGILAGRS